MATEALPLKPIHLPNPIGLWPLAPMWYVLIILLLLALGLGLWWLKKYLRKRRFAERIIKEFDGLKSDALCASPPPFVMAKLAAFIKRVAIWRYGKSRIGGLTGERYLAFLDETGKTQDFSQGVGQQLLSAPYQAQAQFDSSLVDLLEQWLRRQL